MSDPLVDYTKYLLAYSLDMERREMALDKHIYEAAGLVLLLPTVVSKVSIQQFAISSTCTHTGKKWHRMKLTLYDT